jgi:hypothetical protein
MANGAASAWVAGMGSLFILSYAVLAKWYRSTDGRLMMVFGVTITITCSLTLTMTVFGFSAGVDWLRFVQAAVMIANGFCFLIFTIRVWSKQVIRRKRYTEQEDIELYDFRD